MNKKNFKTLLWGKKILKIKSNFIYNFKKFIGFELTEQLLTYLNDWFLFPKFENRNKKLFFIFIFLPQLLVFFRQV